MTYFSFNLKIKILFQIVEVTKQVFEGFVQNKFNSKKFIKKILVIFIFNEMVLSPNSD